MATRTPDLLRIFCVLLAVSILPLVASAQSNSTASQDLEQRMQSASYHSVSRSGSVFDTHSAAVVAPEDLSTLKLAPGSMIAIHVFEEPDLDGTYRLDDAGNIDMPLAGCVHLASLTLRQSESVVNAKLIAEDLLKTPHTTVNVDEYSARNIVVLGEVTSPGRFAVLAPHTLMDMLAMAGGQTAVAGNEIVIHRADRPAGETETVHYGRSVEDPVALRTLINPGDNIVVKRAGIVYVLGAVNRPGGFVMQEAGQLNLAQALALAFGTAPEASIRGIRVLRKKPDGALLTIPGGYNQFRKGVADALSLEAEDIVFVPSNKATSILIRGESVLNSAASATIYTLR